MYNFTNRMLLACGMIPIERMESLRAALRFRILLSGNGGENNLEIIR
jgi:hypothetical protein